MKRESDVLRRAGVLGAAGVLALGLAGCGGSSSGSAASTAAATTAAAPAATEAATAAATADAAATEAASAEIGPDTQAIIDRGTLKVGVKDAVEGFGFKDPLTGEYSGLEISLAEDIAKDLGVDIEFTTVTAATRTELLDSGDIDMVAATFTITDERKKSWDFTTPYYTDHVGVLVEKASGITDLTGLEGKTVGVSSGSTSAKSLVQAMVDGGIIPADDFNADDFDPATWTEKVSFKQYDDYPTISTALTAGEVDAFCVDKSILAIYHTDDRDYIKEEFAPQDYGIATKKDSDFSAYTEAEVEKYLSDGTIDQMKADNNLE